MITVLDILNSQDPLIQYTIEFENENKQLSFNFFRKVSVRNVEIKRNSNITRHIAMGVFKGFLSRAHKICTEKISRVK